MPCIDLVHARHTPPITTAREQKMETAGYFRNPRAGRIFRKIRLRRAAARLFAAGMLAATTPSAFGGAELKLGDDAGLTAGIGLRVNYPKIENGAPNGPSNSNGFII